MMAPKVRCKKSWLHPRTPYLNKTLATYRGHFHNLGDPILQLLPALLCWRQQFRVTSEPSGCKWKVDRKILGQLLSSPTLNTMETPYPRITIRPHNPSHHGNLDPSIVQYLHLAVSFIPVVFVVCCLIHLPFVAIICISNAVFICRYFRPRPSCMSSLLPGFCRNYREPQIVGIFLQTTFRPTGRGLDWHTWRCTAINRRNTICPKVMWDGTIPPIRNLNFHRLGTEKLGHLGRDCCFTLQALVVAAPGDGGDLIVSACFLGNQAISMGGSGTRILSPLWITLAAPPWVIFFTL